MEEDGAKAYGGSVHEDEFTGGFDATDGAELLVDFGICISGIAAFCAELPRAFMK